MPFFRRMQKLSSFLVFSTSYHSGLEQQSDDFWLILVLLVALSILLSAWQSFGRLKRQGVRDDFVPQEDRSEITRGRWYLVLRWRRLESFSWVLGLFGCSYWAKGSQYSRGFPPTLLKIGEVQRTSIPAKTRFVTQFKATRTYTKKSKEVELFQNA